MLVIPAIDLRGGRCVRLFQGDFNRETSYSDDPVEVAHRWINAGAERLHVVDLDGARAGSPQQLSLVASICALGTPVQLGGGLRELEHVRTAIDAGVDRVILGTAAIEHPELVTQSLEEFGPERVVLGIDARDGYVAIRGWEATSTVTAVSVIREAYHRGVRRVVYTDIARDGTLTEPNYAETERVATIGPGIIASGGVSTRATLEHLAEIPGVEAAIIGRALYDGTIEIRSPDEWRVRSDSARSGGADEHAQ